MSASFEKRCFLFSGLLGIGDWNSGYFGYFPGSSRPSTLSIEWVYPERIRRSSSIFGIGHYILRENGVSAYLP